MLSSRRTKINAYAVEDMREGVLVPMLLPSTLYTFSATATMRTNFNGDITNGDDRSVLGRWLAVDTGIEKVVSVTSMRNLSGFLSR